MPRTLKRGHKYYNFSEVVCTLILMIRRGVITVDMGNRFMEAIITQDSSNIKNMNEKEYNMWCTLVSGCVPMERKWFNKRTTGSICPLLCENVTCHGVKRGGCDKYYK
jgi:hypothetical protein